MCGTCPLPFVLLSFVSDLEEGLLLVHKNFKLPRADGTHCQYSDIDR